MTYTRHQRCAPAVARRIFERDGGACRRCGTTVALVVDHIQPRISGGGDEDDNLQTLCAPCNTRKAAGERPPQERRVMLTFRVNATALTAIEALGREWTGSDGARSEVIRCLLAEAIDDEAVRDRARARLLGAHNRLPKGSGRY